MKEIAYAEVGGHNIAYQITGERGGLDVVMVAGTFFSFEMLAEDRVAARFIAGLGALGRLVVFDKRGVGNGGGGPDVIRGGAGDDELSGQGGDYVLNGQGGTDSCIGGPGNDTISNSCETSD